MALNRQFMLSALLVILCLASALGVIYSSHVCRESYAALQDLEAERWASQEQYSRLLLEHSTLASPHRVLGLAEERLQMHVPNIASTRVVTQ